MPPDGTGPDPSETSHTGLHAARLRAAEAATRTGDRLAASTRERPLVVVGAAAVVGLALGWAVLPLVAPAPWTENSSALGAIGGGASGASGAAAVAVGVDPYVALVAEADARRPDPVLAASRLALADPDRSQEALAVVAATHPDAAVASAAARMAEAAGAGAEAGSAVAEAGSTSPGAMSVASSGSRWAGAVVVGLLAGVAAFAVQGWRSRRPPSYRSRARLAHQAQAWSGPETGEIGEPPSSAAAWAASPDRLGAVSGDSAARSGAPSMQSGAPSMQSGDSSAQSGAPSVQSGVPSVQSGDSSAQPGGVSGPVTRDWAGPGTRGSVGPGMRDSAGAMPRDSAGGTASGPWQTEPMVLGRTVQTRYLGPDPRFQRTWLIHDASGGLVGGAGLRPRRVGDAELLEIWCFDRADQVEAEPAPVLVLATPRAEGAATAEDDSPNTGVLVARSGASAILRSQRVQLAVRVAEATLDDSALGFRSLTLDLRPEPRGA